MRLLLFLLSVLPAVALPDLGKARRLLGSQDFKEREALTLEIWQAGREALPLLTKLARDEDPEIARRAQFVLKRVRIGLDPDSPGDLLQLAEKLEQAPFRERSARMENLLEHGEGFRVALAFLDPWLSEEEAPHDYRVTLTRVFVEALLQQRKHWQAFLTAPLSANTRAYLIAGLGVQHSPITHAMIAVLASNELRGIHRVLVNQFDHLPDDVHLILARGAIAAHDLSLAESTLACGLSESKSPRLGRALAFLEKETGRPPFPYEGKWSGELALFRARAGGNPAAILEKVRPLDGRPFLSYASRLLAGKAELPDERSRQILDATEALPVWHLAFGHPPGEPDVEALTSSLVIDWPELARTLTALAHPREAAERLAAEGRISSAVGLLWRTGRRDEAVALGERHLADPNSDDPVLIRLTLSSLLLKAGQREKAAALFRPLFQSGIDNALRRRSAIPLALKMFPLAEVVALEPDLRADRAFRRRRAVPSFLDLPPRVSAYWYEKFRTADPARDPATLIIRVRQYLDEKHPEAAAIVSKDWRAADSSLLPSDPIYQNVFFLQLPETLGMIAKAAWYQLSTDDLATVVSSNQWPLEKRREALTLALKINPFDPALRWFDFQLRNAGDPEMVHLLTLGDPGLALQLGNLTGKRKAIATAARVADFKNAATLRALAILGRSHLDDEDPRTAGQLLLAARCGELAFGTRPVTPISTTLRDLRDLFRARFLTAPDEDSRRIWRERTIRLGAPE